MNNKLEMATFFTYPPNATMRQLLEKVDRLQDQGYAPPSYIALIDETGQVTGLLLLEDLDENKPDAKLSNITKQVLRSVSVSVDATAEEQASAVKVGGGQAVATRDGQIVGVLRPARLGALGDVVDLPGTRLASTIMRQCHHCGNTVRPDRYLLKNARARLEYRDVCPICSTAFPLETS